MMAFWMDPVKHFGDAHRSFIQLLLRKNVILHEEVAPAFLKIYDSFNPGSNVRLNALDEKESIQLVDKLLESLNKHLRLAGMRVVLTADETRHNTEYVTIVSDRLQMEAMAQASGFTTDELAKFQIWLRMMYDQNEVPGNSSDGDGYGGGELRIERALNARIGGLSTSGAQKLISKFVGAQWLIVDETRNVFRLHPRAVVELWGGLQMEFHLSLCAYCRRGITLQRVAYTCACGFVYHARCILKAKLTNCLADDCEVGFSEEALDFVKFDDDVPSEADAGAQRRRRSGATQAQRRAERSASESGSHSQSSTMAGNSGVVAVVPHPQADDDAAMDSQTPNLSIVENPDENEEQEEQVVKLEPPVSQSQQSTQRMSLKRRARESSPTQTLPTQSQPTQSRPTRRHLGVKREP